jgi:hypothetical protein
MNRAAATAANLETALAYAARGWPVFPCKADKQPLTKHGFLDASVEAAAIRSWWGEYPHALVGIDTGRAGLVVVDVDVSGDKPGRKNWAKLVEELGSDLEDTATTRTRSGGWHRYYRDNGDHVKCSEGALAPALDVRADGGYVIAWDNWLDGHGPDTVRGLPTALAEKLAELGKKQEGPSAPVAKVIHAGEGRHAALVSIGGTMRNRGMEPDEILPSLLAFNKRRNDPPYPDAEVRKVADSMGNYPPGTWVPIASGAAPAEADWPAPLGEAAYHGPIGGLVKAWEPHNEADPAAMLVTTLAGFGSVCGCGPHCAVGDDWHPARLFVLIVGESANARKGMSAGPPRAALRCIDPEWAETCLADGLSTGEGLIHRVRNPMWEKEPDKEARCTDPGVTDKRLFVVEGELARMFAAMTREGSTLSQVIRALYDSGTAASMTRQPYSTTGAHVSIVGHITQEELRQKLTDTDAASGFANRFLFVCARRQRLLPFGGRADPDELEPHIHALQRAAGLIGAGEFDGEIPWAPDALPLWEEVYGGLAPEVPGMAGKILGRGHPQVLRIALTYALADYAYTIKRVHLEAALELWRYCAESARHLFGERSGSTTADRIAAALGHGDLTRTQVSDLFDRHKTKAELDAALTLLEAMGRAHTIAIDPGGGRPAETWRTGPAPQDSSDDL